MLFGGFQKVSLIDYPGKICSIAFTIGCNFRCSYCYNVSLVVPEVFSPTIIEEDYILNYLDRRKKYIDALEVTGGEPTLHEDLPHFLEKVKAMGFLIKLDTNGTNPKMLLRLIRDCLVDYIAMDIKAPLEQYNKITNTDVNISNIKKSIETIMRHNDNLDYEFRTTVGPWLTMNDFHEIGELIAGAKRYYIQQFINNTPLLNPNYRKINPFSRAQLKKIKEIMEKYIGCVEIRV